MNKTDKFLYGGFAVVAFAGIVAMLVSIFSPPKQTAEETVEPPQIEVATDKSIEDVPNQMEQWRRNVEAARLQRETEEQYDEGSDYLVEVIQKLKERMAYEKAEEEWWESRKEWVENFPFEPTHHPEIAYDPSVYDARGSAHWPEEKKDKAFWDMMQRVENHGFLRNFYESWLPYSEEFEQMYNIVKEEFGELDNTIVLGWTFNTLKDYHQAAQHDPNEIYRENVTWGEEVESLKEGIFGHLQANPDEGWQGIQVDQALAIRDRLINEIPAEGFIKMGKESLCYVSTYESELKPGDQLLIK